MRIMDFVYSDGGRSNYFRAGGVGDCVTRAICNATGNDYKETYRALFKLCGKTPRNGVPIRYIHKYLEGVIGWTWVPCMKIGSGCTVHLAKDELPDDIIIVQVSGHLSCVKFGVLYDTFDCTRLGNRCVYGYWIKK